MHLKPRTTKNHTDKASFLPSKNRIPAGIRNGDGSRIPAENPGRAHYFPLPSSSAMSKQRSPSFSIWRTMSR